MRQIPINPTKSNNSNPYIVDNFENLPNMTT